MQKPSNLVKLKDMHDTYAFRQDVFKLVFDTENGKLVLDYLKELYDIQTPTGDPNMDYFTLGKRKAILEMEKLTNSQIKEG